MNIFSNWKEHDVAAHNERVAKRLGAGGVKPHESVRLEAVERPDVAGQPPGPSPLSRHSARPSRLRQSHSPKMNKLEREWFEQIRYQHPNYPHVRPHAKTYVLANGVRYTPDFSATLWPVHNGPSRETCWEVKGPKAWDDAIVKIKVAAHEWPEIQWIFVWKENNQWKQQLILP